MKCLSYGKNDFNLFLNILSKFSLVELRQDLSNFVPAQFQQISRKNLAKIILTDRSVDLQALNSFLDFAIQLKVKAIDIDFSLINKETSSIIQMTRSSGIELIVSKHNVDLTNMSGLNKLFDEICTIECDFIKIVYSECDKKFLQTYLNTFDKFLIKPISFISGESMKFTRYLSLLIGSPFTYISYDESCKTSVGQLTEKEFDSLFEIFPLC